MRPSASFGANGKIADRALYAKCSARYEARARSANAALLRPSQRSRAYRKRAICRIYIQTQEWYRTKIGAEALARNNDRFAHLVGLTSPYPFDERGAPIEKISRFNAAAKTQAG